MVEGGRKDVVYVFDPKKDKTKSASADSVTKRLTSYMDNNKEAGEILLELYDAHSFNLFAWMEQIIPEMRGSWIPYIYKTYCMSIPWEFKLGVEGDSPLLDKLMKDEEWMKVFPNFKKRVLQMRLVVEEEHKKAEKKEESSEERVVRLKKELADAESDVK